MSSNIGKSLGNPISLSKNDDFYACARQFVEENACKKGEPNVTAEDFCKWINSTYDCQISSETARRWLHILGFKEINHQKGVYFDGHEREDVVEYRQKFTEKLHDLNRRCDYNGHAPNLAEGKKPLIIIHHDKVHLMPMQIKAIISLMVLMQFLSKKVLDKQLWSLILLKEKEMIFYVMANIMLGYVKKLKVKGISIVQSS